MKQSAQRGCAGLPFGHSYVSGGANHRHDDKQVDFELKAPLAMAKCSKTSTLVVLSDVTCQASPRQSQQSVTKLLTLIHQWHYCPQLLFATSIHMTLCSCPTSKAKAPAVLLLEMPGPDRSGKVLPLYCSCSASRPAACLANTTVIEPK